MKKYFLGGIIASFFAIMLTACGDDEVESTGTSIKSIEILDVPSEGLTMLSGETKKLEIKINPSSARNAKTIWSSSAVNVVSVSQDGNLRAYQEGTATITVSDYERKVTASVKIKVNSGTGIKSIEILDVPSEGLTMISGETKKLEIKIYPESAQNAKTIWSSSAVNVVTVSQDGNLRAYQEGTAKITVSDYERKVAASINVIVKSHNDDYDFSASGSIDCHEYVDMGLSVKWATCNLGATNGVSIGNYYAWQDTKPYTNYTWINYSYSFNPCDNNNILSSKYDAVSANWGNNWRMPTSQEMEELVKPENCDWYWYTNFNNSGNDGYVIRSKKTNKCIFLVAGKYKPHENYITPTKVEGHYWTSWAGPANMWKEQISAISLFFTSGVKYLGNDNRGDGLTIRGVVGKANEYISEDVLPLDPEQTAKQGYSVCGSKGGYTFVDLGLPSRTMWATYNVGASKPTEYGNYYAWGEIKPKDTYTWENYKFFTGYSDMGSNHYAQLSKYVFFEPHGVCDYKLSLEACDDAASVNWRSNWHMPTPAQIDELAHYCVAYETTVKVDGKTVYGVKFESKINNYTMFIPSGGWEYSTNTNTHLHFWYWTNTVAGDNNGGTDYRAWFMTMNNSGGIEVKDTNRPQGLPVRAVFEYE